MAGVTVTLKITVNELDLIREALSQFRANTLETSRDNTADENERASLRAKVLHIDDLNRVLFGGSIKA